MRYRRMPIEVESPENLGYGRIRHNLTESSMADEPLRPLLEEASPDLDRAALEYTDHRGNAELRALIAADTPGATADDVLLTSGAAGALFIVATSLLEPGDHLVVARPNYGSNIETPRAIGCDIAYLDLAFEDGYRVDPGRIAALMAPRTKLVSLTCPHNPTGAMMDEATLRQIVALVEERGAKGEGAGAPRGARLLLDETYRDMTYGDPLPVAAGLGPRAISVSSLSKTYGMPGLRTGWIVCRDRDLMETFLAAKEQIALADSVVDQALALAAYRRRPARLAAVRASIARRVAIVREWVAGQSELEWVEPEGGVVCFPRIRPEIEVDVDRFYGILNERYGTYVGPGHWFEQPRRQMRIGFGWPTEDDLREGLANVSRAVREAGA
jgi:aspartate/methionine/tyrosine aminotransferase